MGVAVQRGKTLTRDGLGEYYRQMISESPEEPWQMTQVLRDRNA